MKLNQISLLFPPLMLCSVFTLIAASAFATANDGFVALPITRRPVALNSTKFVTKNAHVDVVVPEVLTNAVYKYFASFSLGDNQQQVAIIDTGSSDLWVYGAGSGAKYTFDPSNSEYIDNGFSISYLDGTSVSGFYFKDNIKWGSTTTNFQFAVTPRYNPPTKHPEGVFGIAQVGIEASSYGKYPNYPVALKNSGTIQSTAYSLYLDRLDANTGSIVFGAVDISRYTGILKQIPITSPDSGFSVDFEVANFQLNGILDSGTSLTYLPPAVVANIAKYLGATWDSNANAYKAPDYVPYRGITYYFGGVPIVVPASELWLQYKKNDDSFYLTILPNTHSAGVTLLGDTFLRSAYVVYDIDSNQIAIAQADWSPSPSFYKVITSDGIPGAR